MVDQPVAPSSPAKFCPGAMIAAATLLMGMGWGIRGAYGHCTGAMMPGALLGLSLAVCSGREDWWRRTALFGLAGAVGWAFGGQSSYGILIGYTPGDSLGNILYGYATLFLVGGLWGGIGGAILSLAITEPRSFLSRFIGPLIAVQVAWYALKWSGWLEYGLSLHESGEWLYDTNWVKAASAAAVAIVYWLIVPRARRASAFILLVCVGWWAGMALLSGLLGLRINPPRNDSWAGCVGVLAALCAYWSFRRNRAALLLAAYGFFAGGIGFAVGDFFQMLGRAQWGPIGRWAVLREPDYWTVMEMSFGAIMACGVACGAARLVRGNIAAPAEDEPQSWLNEFAVFVLLVHVMWINFRKNVPEWIEAGKLPGTYLGRSAETWFVVYATVLAGLLVAALVRRRWLGLSLVPDNPLGKGQLLFLLAVWMIVLGYFSRSGIQPVNTTVFILASAAASLLVLSVAQRPVPLGAVTPYEDDAWRVDWCVALLAPAAALVLVLLAKLTLGLDMEAVHIRFK